MTKIISWVAVIAFVSAPLGVRAAEKTLTGTVADTKCSAKMLQAGPRTSSQMDGDHTCGVKCIANGEKYVFLSDGKIYQISNQDFAGLNESLGYKVSLVGNMKGDSITVSKIDRKAAEGGK